MALSIQDAKVTLLLQNGWSRAIRPANFDPALMPPGLPVELIGPDSKKYVVRMNGVEQQGELDWDRYCTGGLADWSSRPPMI